LQIVDRFRMPVKLELVEGGGGLHHSAIVGLGDLRLEEGESLPKGEMLGQFDKADQVAALATAVAIEQILAGVDVEGRPRVAMQGTEADEFFAAGGGASDPVTLLQIVQQGNALFDLLRIEHPDWSIKPGRPANQRVVVCKTALGGAAGAKALAG
jgi:hypothetical protein